MLHKDVLFLLSVSSKIAFMRCVASSNVLYYFGLFMNNELGRVYISARVSRLASVTEIRNHYAEVYAP